MEIFRNGGVTERVPEEIGTAIAVFEEIWQSDYCDPGWLVTVPTDALEELEFIQNESSTFNGEPSIVFHARVTDKGRDLRERLLQGNQMGLVTNDAHS